MITVRQIERLWEAKFYARLCNELLEARAEYTPRLATQLTLPVAAAALAIIRLDELSQSYVSLYGKLVRKIVSEQEADGGWSEPLTTALCLRALLCGRGDGAAVERGLTYLANLQKSEGLWPAVPIRRLPADTYVSAFILFQLAEHNAFRSAVRFDDAMGRFDENETLLDDDDARQLWELTRMRCGHRFARRGRAEVTLWS